MFYNPFKKLLVNWRKVLYAAEYTAWFSCCIYLLAGDYLDNPANATLGLLDYFLALPALVKIAESYSHNYPKLKKSLNIISSAFTGLNLIISGLLTIAITPLLYVAYLPFSKKGEKKRKEQNILNLELLPQTPNNAKHIVIMNQDNSYFFSIEKKHVNSHFLSETLEKAFPDIAAAILRRENKGLAICLVKQIDTSYASEEETILALCEYKNNVQPKVLALIEPNETTYDGLCGMEELDVCSFYPPMQKPICAIFSRYSPTLKRYNSKKRKEQHSARFIFESLSYFPDSIRDIISMYAEKTDIKGQPHSIDSDIHAIIHTNSRKFNLLVPDNFDHYLCPITTLMMFDPVTNACGHNYERTSIEKWREEQQWGTAYKAKETENHGCTCPVCRAPLTILVPNEALKMEINNFLTDNYMQLERDIEHHTNDTNNADRQNIITLSRIFLMHGNSTILLQEKYDKFAKILSAPLNQSTDQETAREVSHTLFQLPF